MSIGACDQRVFRVHHTSNNTETWVGCDNDGCDQWNHEVSVSAVYVDIILFTTRLPDFGTRGVGTDGLERLGS